MELENKDSEHYIGDSRSKEVSLLEMKIQM
jgi:hypothetical protein